MKKTYFPITIWQGILLLVSAIIIVAPIMIIKFLFELSIETTTNIIFSAYLISVLVIFYIVNKKRNVPIHFSFKIKTEVALPISILILYQLGINTPFILYIENMFGISTKINMSYKYLLMVIILAPIIEEIIFRGIILKGFLMKYSTGSAILASSILFGLIHINMIQSIGAIIFGLFLGYTYHKFKSIGMTILMHFTINITAIIGMYLHKSFGNTSISSFKDIYGYNSLVLILAFSIIFTTLITYYIKRTRTP